MGVVEIRGSKEHRVDDGRFERLLGGQEEIEDNVIPTSTFFLSSVDWYFLRGAYALVIFTLTALLGAPLCFCCGEVLLRLSVNASSIWSR